MGTQVDIFACGVILFIMYTASPPFEKSVPEDPYYRLIKDKNYQGFWNFHSKRRPAGFFTDDFKDLIQKMLAFDPNERPTMVQVAAHPWVKGPVMSLQDMKDEFTLRKKKVDHEVEQQRIQKEEKKKQRNNALFNKETINRDDDPDIGTFLEKYEHEGTQQYKIKVKNDVAVEDFVIKEQEDYFYSSILTFLDNGKKIVLEGAAIDGSDLEFVPEAKVEEEKVQL